MSAWYKDTDLFSCCTIIFSGIAAGWARGRHKPPIKYILMGNKKEKVEEYNFTPSFTLPQPKALTYVQLRTVTPPSFPPPHSPPALIHQPLRRNTKMLSLASISVSLKYSCLTRIWFAIHWMDLKRQRAWCNWSSFRTRTRTTCQMWIKQMVILFMCMFRCCRCIVV